VCTDGLPPAGYAIPSAEPDCNDADAAAFVLVTLAIDADDDGFTFGEPFQMCIGDSAPPGTSAPSITDDCDETDPAVNAGCANGCTTRPFGARAFVFCPADRDYGPAKDACEARGMDLASIHSRAEQDFIEASRDRLNMQERVWIGFHDDNQSWDDGSTVDFHFFADGGDDGNSFAEDCTNIDVSGFWDDDDCSGHPTFSYICAPAP
jgi:hypothetical protein